MIRLWSLHRWLVAAAVAVAFTVAVGVPTDLIDTPTFSRDVPPTWWAWPSLALSSVLVGLLAATYVSPRGAGVEAAAQRRGITGGLLTFLAVGCPVCNKVVLLALGSAGALTWFQPVQPFLQVAALGLLAWALWLRLRGERTCPAPAYLTKQEEHS